MFYIYKTGKAIYIYRKNSEEKDNLDEDSISTYNMDDYYLHILLHMVCEDDYNVMKLFWRCVTNTFFKLFVVLVI